MPQVTTEVNALLTSLNQQDSMAALKELGAYTLDYSPVAYPIVFFLGLSNTAGVTGITSNIFPTNAVIGYLDATAGLTAGPALVFYQLVDVILGDVLYDPDFAIPSDFETNGSRAWKKLELAY